ncbi:MAG: TonB-dependent receptor [Desulfobacter sp.]|nr:MAG: TonB-dependent receptor [Desulfobacter sp.]
MEKGRWVRRPVLILCTLIGISLGLGTAVAGHGPSPSQDLGEVVVTGDKIEDFVRQNPSQVVSMGAAEIEQRNFLQVQEVLGAMPGVDVKPSAGGLGTRIAIRGGGGSGAVLVLIDGRPAATMQFGGVDLSSIPIDIVKKITVFKPPVPVWLGPDAAAGAVYIETRQKKTSSKAGKKGKIRVAGGSYGLAVLSATGQVDTRDNQFLISGGLSHKDGRRDNSDRDQAHLTMGFARKKEGRQFQVNAKAYVSDHGIAGPTYNPTPSARQRYEKASLDMKYKGFTDKTDYTLKAWTDVKQLDETAQNGDPSKLDTLTAGMGADLFLSEWDNTNELRFGGLAEHNRVDHTLSGKHNRTRVSAHTEYNIRTAPAVYTLGARGDYTNDFDFSPGGHAGASLNLSKATQVKANAGYTEHIPSFGQLYQPSHGAVDQVRGNPDLDKERIVSLSLGLDHSFPEGHKFSVSLFRTDSHDLIKYQRDSSNISEPENIDRAYKQGIEAAAKFALSDKTGIELSYILQETENKDNNKDLSYAPAHSAKLIFKTEIFTKTRLEWTTRGYSKQYSDNDNTEAERLDPYLTTDVKLSRPVTLMGNKGVVFANVHNLFDKDYAAHYGYPDDGIKLELGMSLSF